MLLLFLSVTCQAESLTRPFIVELEQNVVFPNQRFSTKPDLHTLPGDLPGITDTDGYARLTLLPEEKRHRADSYGIKTTIIETISWQWLYFTHLLVAYELILSTKDASISAIPYSWLPVEVVVIVGWLFKNYRNPNSPSHSLIEQQAGQHYPFAATTAMFDSGHGQPQYPPSESSNRQAPKTTTHLAGYFTGLLHSVSGDGNEGPEQHSHTLGFNCFVHPCRGVCELRPSFDSSDSGALNSVESSTGCTKVTSEKSSCPSMADRYCCRRNPVDGVVSDGDASGSKGAAVADTMNPAKRANCNLTVVAKECQQRTCRSVYKNAASLSTHKSKYHSGGKICDVAVVGEDHQQRLCGKIFKHAQGLWEHKRKAHTGLQTCTVTVIGEDGQQRPCSRIYMNSHALSDHKKREHSSQKTCDLTVVGEDGQQRPCGTVFKNAPSLSSHKSRYHTGHKTCEMTVVGEDGQQRPCGMACENSRNLVEHKRSVHSGQQTCVVNMVGEDGQLWPCGKVCKNLQALSSHKSNYHSGQKMCDLVVVDKDRQQRRCAKVCRNAQALRDHKSRYHSGKKTCDVTLVGTDGLKYRCGVVCQNAKALSNHKGRHRKRRAVDQDQNSDLSPRSETHPFMR
ncbi:hypothetical protein [Endozoicomonas sp. ISHI1]|uniref:hypothetical protein n=1 Tax=Endozoicomonas sp. ISHI1 TaxID=2825882 RepID=UPI00214795EB|nr:hypothetical protein [Endozoicomonas sp. ISHI1]